MKQRVVEFAIVLACIYLVLCCSDNKKKSDEEKYLYEKISIGESTGKQVISIGVEFDPHFLSQNITRDDESKFTDWANIVVRRVKMMGISGFRVMVLAPWYEPENDNDDSSIIDWSRFTFNSKEMKSLYAVLDLAQEQGIRVTITLWGASDGHFLANGNTGGWVVAPTDYSEWAENFSALMQYLLNEKKYTCIDEITPVNEPDWSYIVNGREGSTEEYIKMCRVLDERFKKDGIRGRLKFSLSDNSDGGTGTHEYLRKCTEQLADIADVFNSHTYIFGYETPNDSIISWEKSNCFLSANAGKQHFVGEFGGNQCVGAARQKDIDFYKRGILIVRIACNLLNAGAIGVSYWSLLDQYYNKDAEYEQMQQLGLWRYVKSVYFSEPYFDKLPGDYSLRPQYYSYSLLTQFVRPGASIYPISLNDEFIAGTAFFNVDGKWVYLFANQSNNIKKIYFDNSNVKEGRVFDFYQYKEDCLPSDDLMLPILKSDFVTEKGLQIDLLENTVLVCVQK